jgi:hypothetical protein
MSSDIEKRHKDGKTVQEKALVQFLAISDIERIRLADELLVKRGNKPAAFRILVKMTIRDRCLLALESIERYGAIIPG